MAKETLDSNRVNYLLWRYLLENGYTESALRLQKEWGVQDPQKEFDFAPHVTNHALVSVLNKGLLYNASERESTRTTRDVVGPVLGIFGPLETPASPPAFNDEEIENARKHQIDEEPPQHQNGPPGKRQRLSNGYENEYEAVMDVDTDLNGDGHAYPSPEQLPSPIVATNGPERGTQADRVIDLTPDTTFLNLSENTTAKVGNNSTTVLQCEFHPQDPTILAAAGTDALARLWTFTRQAPDLEINSDGELLESTKPTISTSQTLLSPGSAPSTQIDAIAWASDGSVLLVASEQIEGGNTRIDAWSSQGQHTTTSPGFESPIVTLKWNFSNSHYLSLSPSGVTTAQPQGTVIDVTSTDETSIRFFLADQNMAEVPLDAVWISDEEFVIGGGDFLRGYSCSGGAINEIKTYETRPDLVLVKLTYDWPSQLLATASVTGEIDIWDSENGHRTFNAHQGLISALTWQPIQPPQFIGDESERLLASSGEDGAISLWNVRSLESRPKCSMTMHERSVLALAFTPDGRHIAGATSDQVLIWKVDDVSLPRASWTRGTDMGWQTPNSNDSALDEDHHTLSWDANGQKLAYGFSSVLAVMNFKP